MEVLSDTSHIPFVPTIDESRLRDEFLSALQITSLTERQRSGLASALSASLMSDSVTKDQDYVARMRARAIQILEHTVHDQSERTSVNDRMLATINAMMHPKENIVVEESEPQNIDVLIPDIAVDQLAVFSAVDVPVVTEAPRQQVRFLQRIRRTRSVSLVLSFSAAIGVAAASLFMPRNTQAQPPIPTPAATESGINPPSPIPSEEATPTADKPSPTYEQPTVTDTVSPTDTPQPITPTFTSIPATETVQATVTVQPPATETPQIPTPPPQPSFAPSPIPSQPTTPTASKPGDVPPPATEVPTSPPPEETERPRPRYTSPVPQSNTPEASIPKRRVDTPVPAPTQALVFVAPTAEVTPTAAPVRTAQPLPALAFPAAEIMGSVRERQALHSEGAQVHIINGKEITFVTEENWRNAANNGIGVILERGSYTLFGVHLYDGPALKRAIDSGMSVTDANDLVARMQFYSPIAHQLFLGANGYSSRIDRKLSDGTSASYTNARYVPIEEFDLYLSQFPAGTEFVISCANPDGDSEIEGYYIAARY